MPGVVALSLSLISLGANAHTVSDGSAGTQAGQSAQSLRPEMSLPLPVSCCVQIAQATGQPPATPTHNPDTGKGATVTAGDELDELFKESDSALAKVASKARADAEKARADAEKARADAEKARADAEKATADLAETLRRGSILASNNKKAEEILDKCNNVFMKQNIATGERAKCVQDMEEVYHKILELRVNSSESHQRDSVDCSVELSIANMQFMVAEHPIFSDTTFARDGLKSSFKEAFQKELSRLIDKESKSKDGLSAGEGSFCKDVGIEEDRAYSAHSK